MIANNTITYYHKSLNENKLEKWTRKVFENIWAFKSRGSVINVGYENSNKLDVRIDIKYVDDKTIFSIGDIIAIGVQPEIERQSDLKDIEIYNVTDININEFGNNPHIHLRRKIK